MEKNEITLSFDGERMRALTIYLKMENTTVHEPVREYLDIVSAPAARSRRPSRPSQPKTAAPKPAPASAGDQKEDSV